MGTGCTALRIIPICTKPEGTNDVLEHSLPDRNSPKHPAGWSRKVCAESLQNQIAAVRKLSRKSPRMWTTHSQRRSTRSWNSGSPTSALHSGPCTPGLLVELFGDSCTLHHKGRCLEKGDPAPKKLAGCLGPPVTLMKHAKNLEGQPWSSSTRPKSSSGMV